MQVRHESEQAQKVPRSLQHLKHASQFHVGEVWFSGRQIENRTCLFRFCHSLGDRHTRMFDEPRAGRISSWELLQSLDWREYGPRASPEHIAVFLRTEFGEMLSQQSLSRSSVQSFNQVSNKGLCHTLEKHQRIETLHGKAVDDALDSPSALISSWEALFLFFVCLFVFKKKITFQMGNYLLFTTYVFFFLHK